MAVALIACSAAGAEPGAPVPRGSTLHPDGWKQLPAIATAVASAAAGDGIVIDAVDAWGEPGAGCYGVWLALHGGAADAATLADQVLGGATGLAPGDIVKPDGPDGVLAFAFARPPYRGRVRAQLGNGRIAATACFGNQREPTACHAACAQVLQEVP